MVVILALIFLVVPIAELAVIITVGSEIGVLNTVALLIAVSVVGAWLAKREGLGVLRRIKGQLDAGRVPGAELVDGFLVLFAGALLLTPGFLTDCLALALLLPPVRAVVRRTLRRYFAARIVMR
ncbi:MAG: FxsA family protein [Actinomycetota bacterium]|nr:FxsA family protein [Actinomycetota bacterium]